MEKREDDKGSQVVATFTMVFELTQEQVSREFPSLKKEQEPAFFQLLNLYLESEFYGSCRAAATAARERFKRILELEGQATRH